MQPQIAAQGRRYGGIWSVGPESVIDLHAHFMYTSADLCFTFNPFNFVVYFIIYSFNLVFSPLFVSSLYIKKKYIYREREASTNEYFLLFADYWFAFTTHHVHHFILIIKHIKNYNILCFLSSVSQPLNISIPIQQHFLLALLGWNQSCLSPWQFDSPLPRSRPLCCNWAQSTSVMLRHTARLIPLRLSTFLCILYYILNYRHMINHLWTDTYPWKLLVQGLHSSENWTENHVFNQKKIPFKECGLMVCHIYSVTDITSFEIIYWKQLAWSHDRYLSTVCYERSVWLTWSGIGSEELGMLLSHHKPNLRLV